jgi:hypothetical protein
LIDPLNKLTAKDDDGVWLELTMLGDFDSAKSIDDDDWLEQSDNNNNDNDNNNKNEKVDNDFKTIISKRLSIRNEEEMKEKSATSIIDFFKNARIAIANRLREVIIL